jgi:uncharacterized protein
MVCAKTFRDAVHGDMHFSRDEVRLIDTWPMQRLRGIKQLGSSNLVYPSAVHTRFEHSLGTCWIAKRMLRAMEDHYGIRVPDDEARLVTAGALLHDVTHIPYGHTFEDERLVFRRHDEDRERLEWFLSEPGLDRVLGDLGLREAVRHVLGVKDHLAEAKPYVSQIVSYTICADLLDYLKRDSLFCGLAHSYDERIFRYFTLVHNTLVVDLQRDGLLRPDAVSEIIHLLRIRYLLTERVYYHHAKVASGVMISKAVELAVAHGLELRDLYPLRDETLLYALRERFGSDPAMRGLLDKFERRALLRRCYRLSTAVGIELQKELVSKYHLNQGGAREAAEQDLCAELKLPRGAITIYCLPLGVALKEARVLVRVDGGPPSSLEEQGSAEIAALSQKYRDLWRLYVFLDPEVGIEMQRAGQACVSWFGLPNELGRRAFTLKVAS